MGPMNSLLRQRKLLHAELNLAAEQAKLRRKQAYYAAEQQLSKPESLLASFALGCCTSAAGPRLSRFSLLTRLSPLLWQWSMQRALQDDSNIAPLD